MSLLKAHRQTHAAENTAAVDAVSPVPTSNASALHCSTCGKRFSSATRLHSHIRAQHPGTRTWPPTESNKKLNKHHSSIHRAEPEPWRETHQDPTPERFEKNKHDQRDRPVLHSKVLLFWNMEANSRPSGEHFIIGAATKLFIPLFIYISCIVIVTVWNYKKLKWRCYQLKQKLFLYYYFTNCSSSSTNIMRKHKLYFDFFLPKREFKTKLSNNI